MAKFFSFFGIFLAFSSLRAQTATELIAEIEKTYLSGEAVRASFNLGEKKKITITASLTSPKFLFETSSETIVNDGTTVTNYNIKLKQVTISNVASNKRITGVQTQHFFSFSTNYVTTIVKSNKQMFSLELTPKESLKNIFDQVGVTSLIVDLTRNPKQKTVKITSITANAKEMKRKAGNVKITPIPKAASNLFSFSYPKGVTILDLRD